MIAMIMTDMRSYDYYLYGDEDDYGQATPSDEVNGSVLMAINLTSQTIQDNIAYKDAKYIGLTLAPVDDTYVIQYGKLRLKVLYVNSRGRYNQVFMVEV